MPQIIRYGDPGLKITPTFNGKRRPQVQRYGAAGNMPTSSTGDKPSSQQSELVKQILDAITKLPLFVWLQEQFTAAQQAGALTLSPADDVIPSPPVKQEPPRQKYQRAAQPVRYDRPATDVAKYAKLRDTGATAGRGMTVEKYTAAGESRMMYQRHQQAIAGDCVRARQLALDSGCTFEQAMRTLGVQSVPLPS